MCARTHSACVYKQKLKKKGFVVSSEIIYKILVQYMCGNERKTVVCMMVISVGHLAVGILVAIFTIRTVLFAIARKRV